MENVIAFKSMAGKRSSPPASVPGVVLRGPALKGILQKPSRRMSKKQREQFEAWLTWLASSYAQAITRGTPIFEGYCRKASLLLGQRIEIANAEERLDLSASPLDYIISLGVAAESRAGRAFADVEPEFPTVWPDGFHIANVRDKLHVHDLLRGGGGLIQSVA